ncbi:ABC transporter substrate-binding protein [Microbacterium tumbae]
MKKSTLLTAAAVAVTAALALSGCSNSGGGGDADAAPADSGEVTWWGYTPDTPVAEHYIEEFNKEYPDITVTYKNFENVDYRNTMTSALESGQGPDVFDLSGSVSNTEVWGPYALDLAPLAEETLGDDWASKFAGGYAEQLRMLDGTQVSLPLGGMSAGFLWYNKDIFDQAGAEVPTDYDSWVDTCAKITAIGKECFTMGAGGADTFPSELYHAISNSVDPDFFLKAAKGEANWDDPQGIEVLSIIQKMKEDGIISSDVLDAGQYPLANEAFMRGDAAMVQMGYWYTQYSGAESCKISMESAGVSDPTCFVQMPAEFPDVAGKGNGSQTFGEVDYGLAIAADSPNIAASKTFVRWMTMTEKGQQTVANAIDLLPGLQGIAPDWASIELVDNEVQQPAIENLIAESAQSTQTRQSETTTDTIAAIVVAIQQVLDPTVNMSIEDIAANQQATSKAFEEGE